MNTGSGRSDFEWPGVAMFAMLIGLAIALSLSGSPAIAGATGQLRHLFDWPVVLEVRQALIVTANQRDQPTAIATVSPRGFDPLLASCEREVLAQIRAHPGTLR